MKALIFFSALLVLAVNVASGQTTSELEHVSSRLASKAKAITREDYKRIQGQKLNYKPDFPSSFNFYQVDDLLINFQERTINKNEVYSLKEKQRIYQEVADKDAQSMKLLSSETHRYGELDYLVVHYQYQGDEWYTFCSQEYGERKYLFGHLHFNPKDRGKATSTLKEMLSK